MAGIINRRGSEIIPLDRVGRDLQLHASGASSRAPERENCTTSERVPLWLLEPIFVILIALQEWERECGVPSDAPNEKLGRNPPGLARGSKGQNEEEHEDRGVVTGQPSQVVLEHEEARRTVQFGGGSRGERRRRDRVSGSINTHQLKKGIGRTQRLGVPSSCSMSHRKPRRDLVLSKPSWVLSPPFLRTTRFVCGSCSTLALINTSTGNSYRQE